MERITPEKNLETNPLINLSGHILFGGAISIGSYIAGQFVQGVATAIGYIPLSTLPLGVVLGGISFAGYCGYVVLNWTSQSP